MHVKNTVPWTDTQKGAPRCHQDGPRLPNVAPRGPKMPTKCPQDGPMMAQKTPKMPLDGYLAGLFSVFYCLTSRSAWGSSTIPKWTLWFLKWQYRLVTHWLCHVVAWFHWPAFMRFWAVIWNKFGAISRLSWAICRPKEAGLRLLWNHVMLGPFGFMLNHLGLILGARKPQGLKYKFFGVYTLMFWGDFLELGGGRGQGTAPMSPVLRFLAMAQRLLQDGPKMIHSKIWICFCFKLLVWPPQGIAQAILAPAW